MIDFLTPEPSPPVSLQVADDGEFLLPGPNSGCTQPPLHTRTFVAKFPEQSPTTAPAINTSLSDDDGEILLVGPNYAGTWSVNDGTFGEFPKQPPTTPASDDGEILLVGPNSTGTWNFLDGGNFGEFPSEIGTLMTKNPFLADILASSGIKDAAVVSDMSNGAVSHTVDSQRSRDHEEILMIGPDTGTGSAFRRSSPFTGRGLSRPVGRTKAGYVARWSPGSGEVSAPLLSFRPKEFALSQSQGGAPAPAPAPVMLSIPPVVPRAPAPGSPVLCETNLDESTSPVAFVVS